MSASIQLTDVTPTNRPPVVAMAAALGRDHDHGCQVERGLAGALAIVAHDLKGPLANLSLLVESISAEASERCCERIARQAQRAEQLIDRLDAMLSAILQRSRTHGDALEFTPADVDVIDIAEAVVGHNQPLAARRAVRLHCFCAEPTRVHGDAQLLMQAIDNLVSNAVKHTRRGGRVVCEVQAGDEGGAVIRIIDEGPGLQPHDLARAFRPFTRLSARADHGAPSHGLGLWIVRLIAERHGGRVEAENRSGGNGAIFTLRLPTRRCTEVIDSR